MVADALRCKLASDDGLARMAAAGAPGAADAVCDRFREPLARYCRALLSDPEDAGDATQAALERALRALHAGEAPRALRPWLYRIAHNAAMDVARRGRPHAQLDEVGEDLLADARASAAERERLAELLHDLRGLPERQRGALLLRELAGLTYGELAEALGTSAQAARQSVFEARAGLVAAEAGRATPCEAVRRTLSDGDRRRLRGREIRTHLDGCGGCRDFARSIRARRRALALLPAPWVAGAAAAGAGATAVGTSLGGWSAAKGLAAVAAAVTATGTVATVERVARDTEPRERIAQVRPAPKPQPAPRLTAPAPRHRVADRPRNSRAIRQSLPRRRRAARTAAATTTAASPAVHRRAERAERREVQVRRRQVALERRQAAVQVPEVPKPVVPAVRPTVQEVRDRTRLALEQARTQTQQALEAARVQTEQRVREAVTRVQEQTRTAVDEVVQRLFTPRQP